MMGTNILIRSSKSYPGLDGAFLPNSRLGDRYSRERYRVSRELTFGGASFPAPFGL